MSTPAPERAALFGTDLRLLGNLLTAEQRERGADLLTAPRPQLVAAGDPDPGHDLAAVHGDENLQQALLLRLLTEVGELTHLGHPDYGSRLHELIGEPNTPATRDRAKLYALQAITAEPRVAAVRSITVTTHPSERGRIDVRAAVLAVDGVTELNLVFPIPLAGGLP